MKGSSKREVKVLSMEVPYFEDMQEYFQILAQDKSQVLLLESAEISTKKSLKSFLLIDAVLQFICNDGKVSVRSHSAHGELTIQEILNHSSLSFQIKNNKQINVIPEKISQELDEDEKLNKKSVLSIIEEVNQIFSCDTSYRHGVFLGGLFSFELIENFEQFVAVKKDNQCPQYQVFLSEVMLIVNHENKKAHLQASVFSDSAERHIYFELSRRIQSYKEAVSEKKEKLVKIATTNKKLEWERVSSNFSDEEYCDVVKELKHHINVGDIFQIVPARKFFLKCQNPFLAYQVLKNNNPGPYMFYMKTEKFSLFGSSPETSLKYTASDNSLMMCPIAGTRRRGFDQNGQINLDLDSKIELELRLDRKENAEHIMLVDLARNDLARVCEPGSRYISELLTVHRYSYVMHLVSIVQGQLRKGLSAMQAFQACMLMGTLTGAPKIKAIELLRQQEKVSRGSYGGAIGYLNGQGDLDTCIVIRSAYVEHNKACVQAGAGVVYDSVPMSEAEETKSKAYAVLNAIYQSEGAEQ